MENLEQSDVRLQYDSSEIDIRSDCTPTVIFGDSYEILKQMQSSIVDVVVTSPPYWGMRDYGHSDELGKEANSQEYIDRLMLIHRELKRVVKETGVYFLNIGDKYVKKGLEMIPERVAIEMQKSGWVVRNKIIWKKSNPNPSPVKDRFSNAYEVIYMFVHNPDNYLAPDYFFNLDAVREKTKSTSEKKENGLPRYIELNEFDKFSSLIESKSYDGKFNGELTINRGASAGGRLNTNGEYYSRQRKFEITSSLKQEIIHFLRNQRKEHNLAIEEIDKFFGTSHTAGHWFRTDKGGSSLPSPDHWNGLKNLFGLKITEYDEVMTAEHYVLQTVRPHKRGKNPGDVWVMSTANLQEKHFAPFPEKLPERCIKACCPENGIVLDPFVGSGTTLKVAKLLGRKSVGLEINRSYEKIIRRVVDGEVNFQDAKRSIQI